MTSLLVMGAGAILEACALLRRRNDYAGLLIGIGSIMAGIARPGPLGAVNIALFAGDGRQP